MPGDPCGHHMRQRWEDRQVHPGLSQEHPSKAERALPLHPVTGAGYYLAACLVGAYQETLGDLHNLFGDTNAVHVGLDEGQVKISEVVEGDTVREVLSYVQYEPEELRRKFSKSIEAAVQKDKLTLDEARTLRRFYERGLNESTYLT